MAIKTAIAGVVLTPLVEGDAVALHALMQANRAHLTAHGDYVEQVNQSEAALRAEIGEAGAGHRRFGIFRDGALVGRIDLIAVDPPRYSLGYWLAQDATGQGLATASLAAVIGIAREQLAARDLYAGVTHGNERSARLLLRAGFAVTERFSSYCRYHLALNPA